MDLGLDVVDRVAGFNLNSGLTNTRFSAGIVVLLPPVTVLVQAADPIDGGKSLLHLGRSFLHHLLHLDFRLSLGCILVGNGFGISNALLGRILEDFFIVTLRILLPKLCLLHLLVQICCQGIHHLQNTIALFALLGIRAPCCRRRWGAPSRSGHATG